MTFDGKIWIFLIVSIDTYHYKLKGSVNAEMLATAT